MSDTSQGPGWWQASDAKWYPPQQAPNQAFYAAPQVVAPRNSGSATAALVLSILSWFLCPFIGAIIAIVLALSAKSEIQKSNRTIQGDGMATAAIIISGLNIASGAFFALLFLVAALGASTDPNSSTEVPAAGRPAVVAYA